MTFHDIRLSLDVERGAVGGPQFNTFVLELASGFEKRNINWSRVRGQWDIGYGVSNQAAYNTIRDFFYAREGRAHSFRFRDWSDYQLDRQSIGTTDGSTATFQLFKRYSSGGIDYDREITKPLSSGGAAWINGISQNVSYDGTPTASEVDINPLTGIITLGETHRLTSSLSIEIQTDFDIPVRFDTDQFDLNLLWVEAGSVPQLPIVEVRGE